MHLIDALAAGIRGAEQGYAWLLRRGTSTRLAWYDDYEGTAVHPSSEQVTLDVYGAATVYVDELAEVVVFNTDGVQVRLFVAGAGGGSVEVQSPSFTGADYETALAATGAPVALSSVLDLWEPTNGAIDWKVDVGGVAMSIPEAISTSLYFNVKALTYGATGDGTTDDTQAVQDAADAAAVSGGVVFFPPGTYRITSAISAGARVSFLGCGANASKLLLDSGASQGIAFAVGSSYQAAPQYVRDLAVAPNYDITSSGGAMVEIVSGTGDFLIENCRLGSATYQHRFAVLVTASVSSNAVTVRGCRIAMGKVASYGGSVQSYGIYANVDGKFLVEGCTIATPASEQNGSFVLLKGGRVVGCSLDASSMTAGAAYFVNASGTAGISNPTVVTGCIGKQPAGGTVVAVTSGTGSLVCESGNSFAGTGILSGHPVYADTNTAAGAQQGLREGRHGSSTAVASPVAIDTVAYAAYTLTTALASATLDFSEPRYVGQTFMLTVRGTAAGGVTLVAGTGVESLWSCTLVDGTPGTYAVEAVPNNQSHHLLFVANRANGGTLAWACVMRRRGSSF